MPKGMGNPVNRIAAVTCGLFVLILGSPASAQFIFEPEAGIKALTDDVADEFSPGPQVGGAFGYKLSPELALLLHADLGFHSAKSPVAWITVDGTAVTLNILGGVRLSPLGANKKSTVQPFVGGFIGVSSMVWDRDLTLTFYDPVGGYYYDATINDSDGLVALTVGAEGGLGFALSESMLLTGKLRFLGHGWAEETTDGSSVDVNGHELALVGGLSFAF